jgi:hypothetical protein
MSPRLWEFHHEGLAFHTPLARLLTHKLSMLKMQVQISCLAQTQKQLAYRDGHDSHLELLGARWDLQSVLSESLSSSSE